MRFWPQFSKILLQKLPQKRRGYQKLLKITDITDNCRIWFCHRYFCVLKCQEQLIEQNKSPTNRFLDPKYPKNSFKGAKIRPQLTSVHIEKIDKRLYKHSKHVGSWRHTSDACVEFQRFIYLCFDKPDLLTINHFLPIYNMVF